MTRTNWSRGGAQNGWSSLCREEKKMTATRKAERDARGKGRDIGIDIRRAEEIQFVLRKKAYIRNKAVEAKGPQQERLRKRVKGVLNGVRGEMFFLASAARLRQKSSTTGEEKKERDDIGKNECSVRYIRREPGKT